MILSKLQNQIELNDYFDKIIFDFVHAQGQDRNIPEFYFKLDKENGIGFSPLIRDDIVINEEYMIWVIYSPYKITYQKLHIGNQNIEYCQYKKLIYGNFKRTVYADRVQIIELK